MAKQSAYFLLAFVNIGLVPDGGGSLFVPARVGFARAAEMAMLGEPVPAPKAADIGLINAAWPDDEFEKNAEALLLRLSNGPTRSYAGTKRELNHWVYSRMAEHLALEASIQGELGRSKDFAEGIAAFLEKRPARLHRRVTTGRRSSPRYGLPVPPSGFRPPTRGPGRPRRASVMIMTDQTSGGRYRRGLRARAAYHGHAGRQGWQVAAAGRRFAPARGDGGRWRRRRWCSRCAADVGDADSVAALFAAVRRALRPGGPAGQQRGDRRAARRGGRAVARGLAVDRGHQPDRLVTCARTTPCG